MKVFFFFVRKEPSPSPLLFLSVSFLFPELLHLDPNIPTVTTGVENTESGHCAKSIKILKMLVSEIAQNDTLKNIEWVVLADDDVLMRLVY